MGSFGRQCFLVLTLDISLTYARLILHRGVVRNTCNNVYVKTLVNEKTLYVM